MKTELLIERLNAIGKSLAESGNALALIGMGSVGIERERMDEYSDLDFFAIVEKGYKQKYIENIDWLSKIHPVTYKFKNTDDGYKLLYADGIFCEFAVFELHELDNADYAEGKIIWKKDYISETIAVPKKKSPQNNEVNVEWLLGEAITNLYVGLCRHKRGEKLSASRFIQVYAVDRILHLAKMIENEKQSFVDPFAPDRRFEERFPKISELLPEFIQGYDKNIESAKAILDYLENNFEINKSMYFEIGILLK
jgi:lincosamide nucleotidyltransferase